jgi:hypothetical protein
VLLAYGAVDVGLLFGGRAQYGGVLSLTPRYTADMVLILVVVLAGAVRELVSSRDAVPAAHAGRPVLRRTVVCVAVSVGYLVSAAVTSHHTAPSLFNIADKSYVDNLRTDLQAQPGVTPFDSEVPPDVMISWFGAADRVSTVYGIADGRPCSTSRASRCGSSTLTATSARSPSPTR